MQITVLHGDYVVKAYARLQTFLEMAKRRNWEILNDEINLTPSLFGQERLYVIRNHKLLTPKISQNLPKFPGTLVIYNEGTLPAAFLRSLPKETKIEEFKLPKLIWNFLDRPNVKLFHEVIQSEPPEFVFSLLGKRFRDLYWAKVEPESLPYQDWRVGKLKAQAKSYSVKQLIELISELAEIDIKVKTSKADLISALDLFIVKHLE